MYVEVLDLRCSDIHINIYIMYKRHVFRPFTWDQFAKNSWCNDIVKNIFFKKNSNVSDGKIKNG